MRTGHLFAGIDGIGLGLEPHGFETAWFSECEAAPSRVLAHHYPDVPNHGDITAIDWTQAEPVDVLTGGYPCQPFSYAGARGGDTDVRHLWPFYRDAIRHLRPRLALLENVPGHRSLGFGRVLGDLAEAGYDCWWTSLRASDVGAAHRRERVFIVATASDAYDAGLEGRRRQGVSGSVEWAAGSGGVQAVADADLVGCLDRGTGEPHAGVQASDAEGSGPARRDWVADLAGRPLDYGPAIRRWERTTGRPAPAPTVDGRLSADFTEWHMGFPEGWTSMLSRNERLKALGNAVVPQCADVIGRWALELVSREVAA